MSEGVAMCVAAATTSRTAGHIVSLAAEDAKMLDTCLVCMIMLYNVVVRPNISAK